MLNWMPNSQKSRQGSMAGRCMQETGFYGNAIRQVDAPVKGNVWNGRLQAADILVFMYLVSHHNGYKLCDSGKQQIRMECFLILGFTSSGTETVFEMVDGFFHIHTYFVGGVPFLRTPESAGISPKILFWVNIEHPAAGRIRARIFTMADTPAFSGFLIVFPFHFRTYKLHGGKAAAKM